MITHDDSYLRFCNEFVKGYVHRQFDNKLSHVEKYEPKDEDVFINNLRQVECEAYVNYQRARDYIVTDKDLIQPLMILWPEYNSKQAFLSDFRYEISVKKNTVKDVIQLFNTKFVDDSDIRHSDFLPRDLLIAAKEVYDMLKIEHDNDTLEIKVREKPYDHKLNIHAYSAKEQYEAILDYEFPRSFVETIMNRHMIDGMTATRWILEYIKFLSLSTLSRYELFPCDIVDKVWHIHMSYTLHYKYSVSRLKGQVVEHSQECCHKKDDNDQRESYKSTISFYKSVYQRPPPEDIWKPEDEEFDDDKDPYVNINLYRLAVMYYKYSLNGFFLTIPNYESLSTLVDIQDKHTYNLLIRRFRRANYHYTKDPYNWRRRYKIENEYKTSHDEEGEIVNFDSKRIEKCQEKVDKGLSFVIGSDLFVGGGKLIIKFHI